MTHCFILAAGNGQVVWDPWGLLDQLYQWQRWEHHVWQEHTTNTRTIQGL